MHMQTSTQQRHSFTQSSLRFMGLGALALLATALAAPAEAAAGNAKSTAATIQALSDQLQALQAQINALRAEEAKNESQVKAVAARPQVVVAQAAMTPGTEAAPASATPAAHGTAGMAVHLGGVKITPGGYIEAAEIYRSRNENTDIGSSFGGIPLPNSNNYRSSEFRSTAHQSRLSLLAQGDYDQNLKLAGYFEMDFNAAAPTANSNQSNSYTPRMRLAYATADFANTGSHLLFGQGWSLLTLNKTGIEPHTEVQPAGIEAQYVAGYSWARQMQVRVVQDITPWAHLGFSVEEPQAVYSGTVPAGTIVNNTGASQLNPTTTYSMDVAPDLIAKFAMDPGWGHYEVFGLTRWFHDQTGLATGTTGKGGSNTVAADALGGSMILPLIPKMLDFQISGMFGHGIGRYGSSSLPDVTVTATGQPKAIREVQAQLLRLWQWRAQQHRLLGDRRHLPGADLVGARSDRRRLV